MLVVPVAVRPFALGFLTLVLHALGDVPSPPLVGIFLGKWASNCSIGASARERTRNLRILPFLLTSRV